MPVAHHLASTTPPKCASFEILPRRQNTLARGKLALRKGDHTGSQCDRRAIVFDCPYPMTIADAENAS
ncbi:MAG: hypothetical protein ACI89X_005016 [Planctomycetota bacterium]|jgi:hypothetical protein